MLSKRDASVIRLTRNSYAYNRCVVVGCIHECDVWINRMIKRHDAFAVHDTNRIALMAIRKCMGTAMHYVPVKFVWYILTKF